MHTAIKKGDLIVVNGRITELGRQHGVEWMNQWIKTVWQLQGIRFVSFQYVRGGVDQENLIELSKFESF